LILLSKELRFLKRNTRPANVTAAIRIQRNTAPVPRRHTYASKSELAYAKGTTYTSDSHGVDRMAGWDLFFLAISAEWERQES
jgi:hypothetical protein